MSTVKREHRETVGTVNSMSNMNPTEKPQNKAATVYQALTELRAEVMKTRNMAIRVDNTAQNLATILKDVEKRQIETRKGAVLTSIGTYVLFVVVIGVAAYYASDARVQAVAAERDNFRRERDDARTRIADLEKQANAEADAERVAGDALKLIEEGRLDEGVQMWNEKVDPKLLSGVFLRFSRDYILKASDEAAEKELEKAESNVKMANFDAAEKAFARVLELGPRSRHAENALMQLGELLRYRRKYAEAADAFRKLADEFGSSKLADDALFAAGEAYLMAASYQKSVAMFDRLTRDFARSGFTGRARATADKIRRLAEREAQAARPGASGAAKLPDEAAGAAGAAQ